MVNKSLKYLYPDRASMAQVRLRAVAEMSGSFSERMKPLTILKGRQEVPRPDMSKISGLVDARKQSLRQTSDDDVGRRSCVWGCIWTPKGTPKSFWPVSQSTWCGGHDFGYLGGPSSWFTLDIQAGRSVSSRAPKRTR